MKDKLESILGYPAGKELKKMIVKMAKTEGISVEEAAAKFQMPEFKFLGNDGTFTHDGVKMTIEEFKAANPFRRLYVVTTRK